MNDQSEAWRNPPAPASLPYRHLARQIEREFGSRARGLLLAFTSPDSDRFAAEIVLLLAFSLQSELQGNVLVVDAAVPAQAGGVTDRLGLRASEGYAEIASGGFGGREALIEPSGAPNVDVLPAGRAYLGRTGADEREAMASLFEAARDRYRYVLVHLGPVDGDTHNLMGAALADATLVVAVEDHTPMRSLDACRELLSRYGVTDVRVVLTHGKR